VLWLWSKKSPALHVVGHAPGSLAFPPIPRWSPKNLEEALALVDRLSPEIQAAAFNAEAARHRVDFVQADLLPRVSLEAEFRASHEPNRGVLSSQAEVRAWSGRGAAYQAGRVFSQVREAVVRTWNIFASSADTIESVQDQVSANELALESVNPGGPGGHPHHAGRARRRAGVGAVASLPGQCRRDWVVAYQLVAAAGRLTAPNFGLAVPYYDADGHYLRTRGRFFGVTTDTVD
jgi:hypothetical protein